MENLENKNRFFNDTKFAVSWGIAGLLLTAILLSIFLMAKTFNEIKNGSNDSNFNVVTVSGTGEVSSIPDVVTINFTVKESSESVSSAQDLATTKINKITALLKEKGIEEKDIKTLDYNIYPKYEWQYDEIFCPAGRSCPPNGRNVVIGYDVSQNTQLKIREIEKAGELLTLIGGEEVSYVSGLQFSIDNEEALKEQARNLAIADAKEKAKKLAESLGVKLDDIVSYSEGENYPIYGYGGEMKMSAASADNNLREEIDLSVGENKITSAVSITFKIKN